MNNVTPIQWFLILIAFLGALSGSTAQMTDLFGPTVAKDIASGASFLSGLISAILIPLNGQGSQVKSVRSMPGVEDIQVNRQANPTLAALAMDPNENKISVRPQDAAKVAEIAKAAA